MKARVALRMQRETATPQFRVILFRISHIKYNSIVMVHQPQRKKTRTPVPSLLARVLNCSQNNTLGALRSTLRCTCIEKEEAEALAFLVCAGPSVL